jgi:hypothetical protein
LVSFALSHLPGHLSQLEVQKDQRNKRESKFKIWGRLIHFPELYRDAPRLLQWIRRPEVELTMDDFRRFDDEEAIPRTGKSRS